MNKNILVVAALAFLLTMSFFVVAQDADDIESNFPRPKNCHGADLNNDGKVNVFDLQIMAKNWMQNGDNLAGDINHDGIVDNKDLRKMRKNWNKSNCIMHSQAE